VSAAIFADLYGGMTLAVTSGHGLLRALVVDDDSTVRYTVRGILEHTGLQVDEASTARKASRRSTRAITRSW